MKKRGIRTHRINQLVVGLIKARKYAAEHGASIPNSYKIKGRTDYYIYNAPGAKDATITAVFYDGHKESIKTSYSIKENFYNAINS